MVISAGYTPLWNWNGCVCVGSGAGGGRGEDNIVAHVLFECVWSPKCFPPTPLEGSDPSTKWNAVGALGLKSRWLWPLTLRSDLCFVSTCELNLCKSFISHVIYVKVLYVLHLSCNIMLSRWKIPGFAILTPCVEIYFCAINTQSDAFWYGKRESLF